MNQLIERLIQWLKAHGMSGDEIAECIDYITK